MKRHVTVLGGGLAGSEAAWQLARRGWNVTLVEMRPVRSTEIHVSDRLGELVCSNSLGADGRNPAGLLKDELRTFGSLIMEAADQTAVPAGKALAVDRTAFSAFITERLSSLPSVVIERREAVTLPEGPVILATGPLTSPSLSDALSEALGGLDLYFYDAVAPVVAAESLDMAVIYRRDRWGESGTGDYLNCPMEREEYDQFVAALTSAERALLRDFEKPRYFEGCMPVEVLASRGPQTLRFGPMRPVGLERPDGSRPYAVVQLRAETADQRSYNLVGFQTNLKWKEQARVFSMIPGLGHAEFLRYGVMHRNSYVDAPRCLNKLRLNGRPDVWIAGQLSGVEGYVESCAMGLAAALELDALTGGRESVPWPEETATGALLARLADQTGKRFQPVNVNRGIFPPLDDAPKRASREDKAQAVYRRGITALAEMLQSRPDLKSPEGRE